jgi:preprotein translocase subunit SecE
MIDKIKNYFVDVFAEMSKVTWPTLDELKESTLIVLGFSLVFSIAVYLLDTLFGMALKAIF